MIIDWRDRQSVVLADLYDGDRHLILGTHTIVSRKSLLIPHPLGGIRYADGVTPAGAGRHIYDHRAAS